MSRPPRNGNSVFGSGTSSSEVPTGHLSGCGIPGGVLTLSASLPLCPVLQERLAREQRDMEEERGRLQEMVGRMEARLTEQSRQLEQVGSSPGGVGQSAGSLLAPPPQAAS